MKSAPKQNVRNVVHRPLRLEALERREVFSVGGLDPTFGSGWGKTVTDFGGSYDWSNDSAFQADGKIVAVGATTAGGGGVNFAIARYNSDGSLDTDFGGFAGIGDGRVVTDFSAGGDEAQKVLIQPDGKILVIGWTDPFGDETLEYIGPDGEVVQDVVQEHRWAVARYNPDGSIDNSFGVLGKTVVDRPNWFDQVSALGAFILNDKLLLLSGVGETNLLVSRLNINDGSVDVTYGNAGHLVAAVPIETYAATLHGDGIIVAGRDSGYRMSFSRIFLDGSLDSTFGVNGLAMIGPEYTGSKLYAVAVQADGSIVGAGDNSVVRVLANGMVDGNFSVDGVARFENDHYQLKDLAFGSNGTIIAAGWAFNNSDFVVVRVDSEGAPDQSFGVVGVVEVDFGLFGPSMDMGTSVLTYANGKILVSGTADQNFGLTRINGSGVLGSLGRQVRPGGMLVQTLPQSPILFRPGFLLNFVETIDLVIAQQRTASPPTLPAFASRSSSTVARTNSTSRGEKRNNFDDFFAELGDELLAGADKNISPGQMPYQVSLRW